MQQKEKMDGIKRKIARNQWIVLGAGTILFVLGTLRYIFVPGRLGISLKTHQPMVVSGVEFMLLGALLLASWVWTRRNKEKVIQMEFDEIEDEKAKRKKPGFNWGRKRKR